MRIASAALQMDSSHNKQQKHEISESLHSRIVIRSDPPDTQRANPAATASSVQLSDTGKAALQICAKGITQLAELGMTQTAQREEVAAGVQQTIAQVAKAA